MLPQEDIRTILWIIGNALLDPSESPRELLLLGAGGEGKSVAINTIMDNMPGLCAALEKDYMGRSGVACTAADISNMFSSRLICYGDVQLEGGQVNIPFMKMLTGGDKISANGVTGICRATGLFALNELYYPTRQLMGRWAMRRLVVIKLDTVPVGCPRPPASYSEMDILMFMNKFFGSRVGIATRGIVIDPYTSQDAWYSGTLSMAECGNVTEAEIVNGIGTICPSLVAEIFDNLRAVVGIRPAHVHYGSMDADIQ